MIQFSLLDCFRLTMLKVTADKKRQVSIADENANATPLKNLTSTPVASKSTAEFNTPRTQLRGSKIKTPFKTPLTSVKPTGLITPGIFVQPKKLDFDCFEDSDLEANVESKPDPILEEDEDVENWEPETGDTRPYGG